MGKEVSEFTGLTYFEVMAHPAIEIIGVMVVMRMKAELMK